MDVNLRILGVMIGIHTIYSCWGRGEGMTKRQTTPFCRAGLEKEDHVVPWLSRTSSSTYDSEGLG